MKDVAFKFLLSIIVSLMSGSLASVEALEPSQNLIIYTDVIDSLNKENCIKVYNEDSVDITEEYFTVMTPLVYARNKNAVTEKFDLLKVKCIVSDEIMPSSLYNDAKKVCTIYGNYTVDNSYKVEVTVYYQYNDLNGNLTSIKSWTNKYVSTTEGRTGEVLSSDVKKAGIKSINISVSVQCNETREYDYTGETFSV